MSARGTTRAPLSHVLTRLGLTGGLKTCLDAGDAASLGAGATEWLGTGGTAANFWLGTDATGETADPTINGTAGALTAAEYLSGDGDDQLAYADTANPAWAETLHKAGTAYSIALWAYVTSVTGANPLIGTQAGTTSAGISVTVQNLGRINLSVGNGSVSTTLANDPTAQPGSMTLDKWMFVAFSVDEAAGAAVKLLNGVSSSFSGTYGSPSSSAAAGKLALMARGGAANRALAGTRLAQVAIWQAALPAPALLALYDATRTRFGA